MTVEDIIGQLPSTWEYTTLGEVCRRGGGNIQTGPFGSQLHAADYVADGIPSIMPANIGDNRLNEEGIARITPSDAERLSRYRVRTGDIVYSRRGDVERRALIREREDGWLCGTGCLRVSLGYNISDPSYAAFYLGHPLVREWIVRHAHGATMANLNTEILSNCPFVLPPLAEQQAITRILSALDDKIELNRQMNETLEAMAHAIFKDWFVDFGPTRAKMEGSPPYLDPDIWSLFPDRLDDDGKPQGWENSTIGQEVDVVGGSTPSTKEATFWGGNIAWATPKDLSSLSTPVLLGTERQITDAGLSQVGSGLLPVGAVLLSSRAPIGYMAIAQIPVAINQGFIAMVCRKRLSNVFCWLWTQANMETVHQNANGSTFQEISKANFKPIGVTICTPEILKAFEETVVPLFERIVANEKESRTLAATRDLLLPKLMSGEIRVRDAENLIGKAT
jgi:type I restriction enzyme S subunit